MTPGHNSCISATDGQLCRPSQPYALEKLRYVAHYQNIFATGMKWKWPERVYVDLLAGPGRCKIEDSGEEFEGSPVTSLAPPFTKRVFVESDAELVSALKRRVPVECEVISADCNSAETVAHIRRFLPASALGLAFVDNLGLDVSLGTLRALTADRKVDLMIVVQLQDLTRNVQDVIEGKDDRTRLDEFFGSSRWEVVAKEAKLKNAAPSEVTSELVDFYGQQLGTIGYDFVAESRRVMKNSRNAAQYRLVLAGKHERATDFFRKIEKIDLSGQRSLL